MSTTQTPGIHTSIQVYHLGLRLLVDLHGGEVEVGVRHDGHDLQAAARPIEGGQ